MKYFPVCNGKGNIRHIELLRTLLVLLSQIYNFHSQGNSLLHIAYQFKSCHQKSVLDANNLETRTGINDVISYEPYQVF